MPAPSSNPDFSGDSASGTPSPEDQPASGEISDGQAEENAAGHEIGDGAGDSFESNPNAALTGGSPADGAPGQETGQGLPTQDNARIAPRSSPGDAFETNPLAALREPPADTASRHALEDSVRVREALRSVIEEGDHVDDAAREWNVAPSAIAEWRNRYRDLLQQDSSPGTTLLDPGDGTPFDTSVYIPQAAREIFLENWERLVAETNASPSDFVQNPRQVFLETSPYTSWLYQEGRLDRSILAGALSCLVGLVILVSFLTADRKVPDVVVALPEPPPRDDLVIEEASAVAQSFFKAPNWEERLKFVREPETVREKMQEFYQTHPDGPIDDAMLTLAMPVRHLVNLSYEVPSLKRNHFLCIVIIKGRYLVDWESSSLYQEAHLDRLRETKPTEPVRITVTATKDGDSSYYNYAFGDESRWECYRLGYPGLNINLFGYAVKDSSDAIALDAIIGIVGKQAVVLDVRFPPDAQTDNQVEILGLIRQEWVPSDP